MYKRSFWKRSDTFRVKDQGYSPAFTELGYLSRDDNVASHYFKQVATHCINDYLYRF